MWTIKELSDITGIDYETVRYYCRSDSETTASGKKRERKGAGILRCTCRHNGVRHFDKDALLELLFIDCMRKAGIPLKEIRSILGDDVVDVDSLLQKQLEELECRRSELDDSIRTTKALIALFSTVDDDNDEEWAGFFSGEIISMAMSAATKKTIKAVEDGKMDARELEVGDDFDTAEFERILNERKGLILGDKSVEDVNAAWEKLDDFYEGTVFKSPEAETALEGFLELWSKKADPGSAEVQRYASAAHDALRTLMPNLSPASFAKYAEYTVRGNSLAVILELSLGRGFTSFVVDAAKAFAKATTDAKREPRPRHPEQATPRAKVPTSETKERTSA